MLTHTPALTPPSPTPTAASLTGLSSEPRGAPGRRGWTRGAPGDNGERPGRNLRGPGPSSALPRCPPGPSGPGRARLCRSPPGPALRRRRLPHLRRGRAGGSGGASASGRHVVPPPLPARHFRCSRDRRRPEKGTGRLRGERGPGGHRPEGNGAGRAAERPPRGSGRRGLQLP